MDRQNFKNYVIEWSNKIGVSEKIKAIHLRHMKRKIASCSSKGILTFNPSILDKPKKEMDYIIVHELLHLRYQNHGKMFKHLLNLYVNT
jgi:predicted metal-dependent hydrolase